MSERDHLQATPEESRAAAEALARRAARESAPYARIEALEAALREVNARASTHVLSLSELKTVLGDIRQIIARAALKQD